MAAQVGAGRGRGQGSEGGGNNGGDTGRVQIILIGCSVKIRRRECVT